MARKSKLIRSIPEVVIPDAKTLKFSFKHLDVNNQKFPVHSCTLEFWQALISELHRYSMASVDGFIDVNHQDHRHLIHFQETSEPNGFSQLDMEQVGYMEAWQFRVGRDRWRVTGFVIDDTFYLVWLDPHHALYPGLGTGRHRG